MVNKSMAGKIETKAHNQNWSNLEGLNCFRKRPQMKDKPKHLPMGHYGDCAIYRVLSEYNQLKKIYKVLIEANLKRYGW